MAQRLPDLVVDKARSQHPVVSRSLKKQHSVESKKYCVYNRTREQLLGSDVNAADSSAASFNDRIRTLAASPGAGVWLVPFRGTSFMSEEAPLDLIYLDANSVVIDVVDSFPIFSVSQASPPAASVLALPRHTICSTKTRRGDQLLFCTAAEFDPRILELPGSNGNAGTAQNTDSGMAQAICSSLGGRPESNDVSGQVRRNMDASPVDTFPSGVSRGNVWNDRKSEEFKPRMNWLQRWWYLGLPEPRKAPRESFPGLAAHFWTGDTPVEHRIRDISQTGLYVITDERWFAGTVVRMTLTDSGESTNKNSITANTSVVRWGDDGVGLTFVMKNEWALRRGHAPVVCGIGKKALNRFLELARSGKRDREAREVHLMLPRSDGEEAMNSHADPVFDGLFIGPINSSLLIRSLKDLPRPVSPAGGSPLMDLPDTSRLQSPDVVSATPSLRRPCILLIDDDQLEILFLAGALEGDYEVIFAFDGVTALESAGRHLPDLILLDVMMPGIDGFEVCRRLKADSRTKEIPVIFITGLSEAAAETKGLKMGAVDYISKPFHPAPLRARVDMHIKFKMAQDS
jgi:CheY-like chemotaxis protein